MQNEGIFSRKEARKLYYRMGNSTKNSIWYPKAYADTEVVGHTKKVPRCDTTYIRRPDGRKERFWAYDLRIFRFDPQGNSKYYSIMDRIRVGTQVLTEDLPEWLAKNPLQKGEQHAEFSNRDKIEIIRSTIIRNTLQNF